MSNRRKIADIARANSPSKSKKYGQVRHRRNRDSWAPKTSSGSISQEPSKPGSLIGGIRSQGIRAVKPISTDVPIQHELTEEERKAKWQPPERDKAWFSGTNASRHKASSSYKVPSDYSPVTYDDGTPEPVMQKKKSRKKISKAVSPVSAKTQRNTPVNTSPLSAKEARILDNNYRVHGGRPQWEGWDTLLPGRSADFLLSQIALLGFDRPDDKKWTKGEKAVLRENRRTLSRYDTRWARLLPRKSVQEVARAYVKQSSDRPHLDKKKQQELAAELGWTSGQQRKKKTGKRKRAAK